MQIKIEKIINNKKKQKGITIISLVITIIVLMILAFTIAVNITPIGNQTVKTKFENDIKSLKGEVELYYTKNNNLPIINRYLDQEGLDAIEDVKNINDNNEYYVIDINKLNVYLNYGADYESISQTNENQNVTNAKDVYIINVQSHTIYYPKGQEYDGSMHYRENNIYTEV